MLSARYDNLEEAEVEAEHARSAHNMREVELLGRLKQEITKQVIGESRQVRPLPLLTFRAFSSRVYSSNP